MNKLALTAVVALIGLTAASAFAAPNTYQVTGPVLAMTSDKITVQKGTEKWEIATGSAAIPAGVQVGSKVTILYTMTASTITAKAPKAAATK